MASTPKYTFVMPISGSLKDMTLQEKLAVMESIWEDLARAPGAIGSLASHKDELDERGQWLTEANCRFTDCEMAKGEFVRTCRENRNPG